MAHVAISKVVGAVDADCSTVCATIDSECGPQGCCQPEQAAIHPVLRCVEGAWPNTAQEWDSVASSAEGLALKGPQNYGRFSIERSALMIFAYLCLVSVMLNVGRCCGTRRASLSSICSWWLDTQSVHLHR